MRIPSKLIILSLLALLALPLAAQQREEPKIIEVESVQHRGRVVVGGSVIPYKEVTLSAQIPGRIEYVAGEEGDEFESGDLLVAISEEDLLAKRRGAVAQLRNAQQALRNARVQYYRAQRSPQTESLQQMPGMGMPSLFDKMFTRRAGEAMGYGDPGVERGASVYSSWSQVSQAQSQVEQARSRINEIDAKLRDARSIAPFDGVIMEKVIEEGDTVQPGQPLVRYAHTKYLRIQADVPTRVVPNLDVGMIVPAFLDVGNTRIKARVARIYPQADPARHTVTVKFDLPKNAPGGPGMYAEVVIPERRETGRADVIIPQSAIIRGGSLPSVLVVTNGSSELRMVRLGAPVGDNRITVTSGLQPGTRIVDNPPPGASSGWMPDQKGGNGEKGKDKESS